MALALVAHGMTFLPTSGGTTGTFDTGTCNLIVVAFSYQAGLILTSCTDSKSNTYTQVSPPNQGVAGGKVDYWYTYGVNCGDSALTFTVGGNGSPVRLGWASWSGAKATDPYVAVQGNNSGDGGAPTSTLNTGSISTNANEVAIAALVNFADTDSSDRSIDSSFTITDQDGLNNSAYGLGVAYKFQTGASENPTWSWTSGDQNYCRAAIITFVAAAGGAAPVNNLSLLGVGA